MSDQQPGPSPQLGAFAQQPPPKPPPYWRARRVVLGVAVLILTWLSGLCTGALGASSGSSRVAVSATPTAAATPVATAKPTATPTPPPPGPKVLLDFQGSGIKSSPEFDAPSHWKLAYTYDCSNIGFKGNFIVGLNQGSTPVGVLANELGTKGEQSTDVYRQGRLHIEVNSACNWHLTATTV